MPCSPDQTIERLTMKNTRFFCVAVAALALGLSTLRAGHTSPSATPTFSKDVAPIIFKNCAGCHRPDDIAPMSLLSYEEARPWAKAIREQVSLEIGRASCRERGE